MDPASSVGPAPGASGSGGSKPEFAVGPDGQPTLYPAPLFVRNTFLEVPIDRPASLEDFLRERQACSCPGSSVSQPGSSCDFPGSIPSTKRVQYRPGELLARSAAFGSKGPLAMYQAGSTEKVAASVAPNAHDQDVGSECSTVDTLQRQRSCVSPAPEFATPAPLEPVQDLLDAAKLSPPRVPELPAALTAPEREAEEPAPAPAIAKEKLPSIGSAGHRSGHCKPCAFMHTKGCSSGVDCKFCHLCEPGEKQRRQKEKRAFFGTMRQLQKMAVETWGGLGSGQQ